MNLRGFFSQFSLFFSLYILSFLMLFLISVNNLFLVLTTIYAGNFWILGKFWRIEAMILLDRTVEEDGVLLDQRESTMVSRCLHID